MGAIFDKDGDQSYKFINGVRVGKNSHRKWYVLANSVHFQEGLFDKFLEQQRKDNKIKEYEFPALPVDFIVYERGKKQPWYRINVILYLIIIFIFVILT